MSETGQHTASITHTVEKILSLQTFKWKFYKNLFSPFYPLRYRRSYDSEFTAPLVAYHVWPALMEGDVVIVKGEAVTRRGALVYTHTHKKPTHTLLNIQEYKQGSNSALLTHSKIN